MIDLDALQKAAELATPKNGDWKLATDNDIRNLAKLRMISPPQTIIKLIDCAKALKEARSLMGPKVPDCCGCVYEWTSALAAINKALKGVE